MDGVDITAAMEAGREKYRRPIPGAPEGKTIRDCQHDGPFYLVRAFDGISIYQCLKCRKCSDVETRQGKTCMNCGKPLTGRQVNWCCAGHGTEVWASHDRGWWREAIKKRDAHTCQRCGYQETPETKEAYKAAHRAIALEHLNLSNMKHHYLALQRSGTRRLEAHHIHPLEWGGAEFDQENGKTLCHPCHDQEHRELNATRRRLQSDQGENKQGE